MLQAAIDSLARAGFQEFEVITAIKLILASICGGLIGIERELKGRPAGMKTFSLVCIGSTLVMITNEYINTKLALGGDNARMAAQVISGIGFLGAGTIMVTKQNQVKGLSTAAALWVTAALGIAIGTGFYFGALAGLIVINLSSVFYQYVEHRIGERSRLMKIYIEGMDEAFMLKLLDYFHAHQIRVLSFLRRKDTIWYQNDTCAMIEMEFRKGRSHQEVLAELKQLEGLRYVEEI